MLSEDGDEGAAAADGADEDSKLSQAELDKVAVSLHTYVFPGTTCVGSYGGISETTVRVAVLTSCAASSIFFAPLSLERVRAMEVSVARTDERLQ